MFDFPIERRRFFRSRADIEFQLARITLALSRAPMVRRAEVRDWFDEAAAGLASRAAPEHRDYVDERVASIRDTFFGDAVPDARQLPAIDARPAPGRMH